MTTYHLGTRIGSGGFAEVLECARDGDRSTYALKRLLSRDPEHVNRFAREIRMQATLSHPNILPIISHKLSDDPPWAILPRAVGNMRQLMTEYAGVRGAWMVLQAATGLMHAHANGIIHRDLKPENILYFIDLDGSKRLCVADFGLGRFMDRDSTAITLVNMGLGTLAYMAPEQFTDAINADHRADVYAMGKILYEVLTGKLPYPTLDTQLVPSAFRYIVQKATQSDKLRRHQSIDQFLKDLTTAVEQPENLTKPADQIKSFLKSVMSNQSFTPDNAEELAKLFIENLDDTSVLLTEFPQLSDESIAALCKYCIEDFIEIIKSYDVQVSGGISFAYCDTAADFLERIWEHCPNDEVRGIILNRLARMGAENNRWHVGEVLGRIVNRLDGSDPGFFVLRDAVEASARVREFNKPYLLQLGLPKTVRDALSRE